MIRTGLLIFATAACLAGCGTTGTITIPPISPTIDPTIAAIVAGAKTACGFAPTAETVAGIIASLGGAGAAAATVDTIVNDICGVVSRVSARRGAAAPVFRGVPIRGRFVR